MKLILECLCSIKGDSYGKVLREQSFDQKLAENVLRKSANWRLKEGQGYQFKDSILFQVAVSEKKEKKSKQADKKEDIELPKKTE